MPEGQAIESRACIDRPYEQVRDLLRADALAIFSHATKVAEERRGEGVAALNVNLGGLEVRREITVTIRGIREDRAPVGDHPPVTSLEFEWQAADSPGWVPTMKAELRFRMLSSSETEVMLVGVYTPPRGILGTAFDAVFGGVAEASVQGFVAAVVQQIRCRAGG